MKPERLTKHCRMYLSPPDNTRYTSEAPTTSHVPQEVEKGELMWLTTEDVDDNQSAQLFGHAEIIMLSSYTGQANTWAVSIHTTIIQTWSSRSCPRIPYTSLSPIL